MGTDAKRFYPVFLDLDGRLVVIVGGGPAALRRAKKLAGYGADVMVVAEKNDPELAEAQGEGTLTWEQRGYVRGDLAGAHLVFCVETDPEIRSAVRAEAETSGCLFNVAGDPDLCNFIVPSVVNREPLQIAISTGGLVPGLTKQIRHDLAKQYGPAYADYAQVMSEITALVFKRIPAPESREAVLSAIATSGLLERLQAGGAKPSAGTLYAQFAHFAERKK